MNPATQAAIIAAARPQGAVGSHTHDYAGPANGDYVAYLQAIEARQLQQLERSQSATPDAMSDPKANHGGEPKRLSAAESAALMARLRSAAPLTGRFGVAQLVMAFIGLSLIVSGLFGDGGGLAALIGVGLLWVPVQRLHRALKAVAPTQRADVDKVFGPGAPKS